MSGQLSDDDGTYLARAWRRCGGVGMDAEPVANLYAWVRSVPPSYLLAVLGATHTPEETLALIEAAAKAGGAL